MPHVLSRRLVTGKRCSGGPAADARTRRSPHSGSGACGAGDERSVVVANVRYVAPSLASHSSSGLPDRARDFRLPVSRPSISMELPG